MEKGLLGHQSLGIVLTFLATTQTITLFPPAELEPPDDSGAPPAESWSVYATGTLWSILFWGLARRPQFWLGRDLLVRGNSPSISGSLGQLSSHGCVITKESPLVGVSAPLGYGL